MKILFKKILILILIIINSNYGIAQKKAGLSKYHLGITNNSQSNNRAKLLLTAREQNVNQLDSLLSKGLDINEPDVYGSTILGDIVQNKVSLPFIDLLLQRGACLNCGKYISQYIHEEGIESDYRLPLCNAIMNQDPTVFIYLLMKYKNMGCTVLSRKELVETAIISVNYRALLELFPYFDFSNVNDRNITGQTLLTQTAESLAILYVQLSDDRKNSEIKDLLTKGIKIMELLIVKGADINKPNDKGETVFSLLNDISFFQDFLTSKKAK